MISFINELGLGVIGTPDECAAQTDRLNNQPNGGFGCSLMLARNRANRRPPQESHELIARHVVPVFQKHGQPTFDPAERAHRGPGACGCAC
jgi:hypothetical protein